MDLINSLSFQNITSKYTRERAQTEIDALRIIVEDYQKDLERCYEKIESYKKIRHPSEQILKDMEIQQSEIQFFAPLLDKFYAVHNTRADTFVQTIKGIPLKTKKLSVLKLFFEKYRNKKTLVFSDYQESFKEIHAVLDSLNIKYTELSKGTTAAIVQAIDDYKNGDINILLIDASNSSCGMNLENSDCIVFIHRTNDTLNKPVIGRAHRKGGKGTLD